jgi:hypothetical protein
MKEIDREAPPLSEEPAEGGGEISGACVAVPDGEYELRYINYETALFFGSPKVILHCSIIEPADFAGLPVDRFYNVTKLTGPPGRYGNYVAPARGDLLREYRLTVEEPTRRDRISFRSLKGKRLIAKLETVVKDHQHNSLAEDAQYSRISRLVRVLPGDEW